MYRTGENQWEPPAGIASGPSGKGIGDEEGKSKEREAHERPDVLKPVPLPALSRAFLAASALARCFSYAMYSRELLRSISCALASLASVS